MANTWAKMGRPIVKRTIRICLASSAPTASDLFRAKCYKPGKTIISTRLVRVAPSAGTPLVMEKKCFCKGRPFGIPDAARGRMKHLLTDPDFSIMISSTIEIRRCQLIRTEPMGVRERLALGRPCGGRIPRLIAWRETVESRGQLRRPVDTEDLLDRRSTIAPRPTAYGAPSSPVTGRVPLRIFPIFTCPTPDNVELAPEPRPVVTKTVLEQEIALLTIRRRVPAPRPASDQCRHRQNPAIPKLALLHCPPRLRAAPRLTGPL